MPHQLTATGTARIQGKWRGIRALTGPLKAYRGWEYWNTYLFELPAYLRLAWQLFQRKLGPRDLLRANWALDHGGFAFASKFSIQRLFPPQFFPPTLLIPDYFEVERKVTAVLDWQESAQVSFPLILKPDQGRIGMGVVRVRSVAELKEALSFIEGDYLAQKFVDLPLEAGVFVYRGKGPYQLLNLTLKELPSVVGDGSSPIAALVDADSRLRRFSSVLSRQVNERHIPLAGERCYLSYVGNHAQGAVFHARELADPSALLATVTMALGTSRGFNYGRLDVRSPSIDALLKGDFTIIEVNGVDSLSTNIFDPKWSIFDAYRELFRQYDTLVEVADENREVPMPILSISQIIQKVLRSESVIRRNHRRLMNHGLR